MNKRSEGQVIDSAVAALNDLGVKASLRAVSRNMPHADAVLTVRHGGKTLRYLAEVKRRLTSSLIGPISLAFAHPIKDRLLITDYATPPLADALRLRGVQFVDTAGNAFLNREGLLVIVTGRTLKTGPAPPTTLRVFRRSGLQVTFALLSAPTLLSAPQRTIADAAGVSLGSVAPVLEGLRDLGFIADIRGTRRFVDRERLINQWSEGYARVLLPSLELGRFTARNPDWWRTTDPDLHGAQWGGETAAALLQQNLVPEQTILYSDDIPAKLAVKQRLKADPNGQVVVRRRFWNSVPSPRPEVVPPLLIYADLVAVGDARSLAAAKEIRKTYLD
jgi:hypothetical protein